MISIVCVYNKKDILSEYLIKSLKSQTYSDYELILLDNQRNKYESASTALNIGVKRSKGEWIMFVHQDIKFEKPTILSDIARILSQNSRKQEVIFGVAGRDSEKGVLSNITNGYPPVRAGVRDVKNDTIEVQTVDECLFVIPRLLLEKIKFDEKTIHGWHLYAVDYCLEAYEKFGVKSYVMGVKGIYHKSSGSLDKSYFEILRKVANKHKNIKRIYTTMGTWPTNKFMLRSKIFLLKAKIKLRQIYKK